RSGITHVLSLLGTGAFYAAYAAMAILAAAGKLTLGDMTLYIMSFRSGQSSFQSALGAIGSMYEHNLYMSNLFSYFELAGSATPRSKNGAGAAEGSGIRVEGVGFKYPGKDAWALRRIDLAIGKGESIALVGENGAGKTTLIKLLTRLY